jgi:hypothetical protein
VRRARGTSDLSRADPYWRWQMALYKTDGQIFVSPTQAKMDFDGDSYGGVYVYEMNSTKGNVFQRMMNLVPKAMVISLAVIVYAQFAIESDMMKVALSLVMFLPMSVYFGALYISTSFPRMVGVGGSRLKLLAVESMSFCIAQISSFVPPSYFFLVVALQMDYVASSKLPVILALVGGVMAFCVFSAVYRYRLVLRVKTGQYR